MVVVGLISDTHGLLRPEALASLQGVDAIVHAGDVGDRAILDNLQGLAPVTAIRGNVDRGDLARELPATALIEMGGIALYVIHDLAELDLDPATAGIGIVVSGHTHTPLIQERRGVLYVNPGSAGPRRFSLPVTTGLLYLGEDPPRAEIVRILEGGGSGA